MIKSYKNIGDFILKKEGLLSILLITVVTAVSFFAYYLKLNLGTFESPAFENLPLIRKLLDPSYLLNDFYTNAIYDSPRIFFSQIVVLLSKALSLDWFGAFFFAKLILVAMSSGVMYLAHFRLARPKNAYVFTGLFCLCLYLSFDRMFLAPITVGGWLPTFFEPIAHTYSIFFLYLGLIFIRDKGLRFGFGISSIALGTAIHPSLGILINCLTIPMLLFLGDETLKSKVIVIVKIFLAQIAVMIALRVVFPIDQSISDQDFIRIFVNERHPHHYLMSNIWAAEKGKILFVLKLFAGAGIFAALCRCFDVLKVSLCYLLFFIISLYGQYAGIELLPLKIVAQVAPIRMNSFGFWMLVLPVILVIANRFFPKSKLNFDHRRSLSFLVIISIFISTLLYLNKKPKIEDLLSSQEMEFFDWLKKNTDNNVVIATYFNEFNNFHIRLFGERAIFVDRAFPFNEEYVGEWNRRFHDLWLDNPKMPSLSGDFKVDYLLAPVELENGCQAKFQNSGHYLYKVSDCPNLVRKK